MKDRLFLGISRGKSFIHVIYKGEIIAKIEVSEANRGNQSCLALYSDKELTKFKLVKDNDESHFNKEKYNV